MIKEGKTKKIIASLLLLATVGPITLVPVSVLAESTATSVGAGAAKETLSWGGKVVKVAGGVALAAAATAAAVGLFVPAATLATAATATGVVATGLTFLSGLSASTVIGTGVVGAAAYQLGTFIDGGGFTGVTYGVVALLATIVKTILGGLLELAGRLFDWAIQLNFTIDFKNMSVVKAGWTLIRDFMNMGFLFLLLYLAIGTILQLQGVDAKKTVSQIILAALLVNFSIFITGIFWDASTILVREFYIAISGGAHRVSDLIAVAQNLAGMLDKGKLTGDKWTDGVINEISTVVVYGIFLRFLFVTSILFVSRIATFMFLFITSPISVIGGVLPGLGKYSTKWWDTLIKQVILGPFIMFVLYLVLRVTEVAGTKLPIFFTPGPNSPDENFLPYMQFMIIMVLLNFGVSGAKEYAGEVGAMALSAGKQALGAATGFAIGTAALAGQGTFGAVAQRVLDKKGEFMDPNGIFGKGIADRVNKWSAATAASKTRREWFLNPAAKGTFDPRNAIVPGGKRFLGQEIGLLGGYGSQAFGQMTDGVSYGAPVTGTAEKRDKEETEMAAAEHQEQMKFLRKTAVGDTDDEKKRNGDIAVARYLQEIKNQDVAVELYKKMPNSERYALHDASDNMITYADQLDDEARTGINASGRTLTTQEKSERTARATELRTASPDTKKTLTKFLSKQEPEEEERIKKALKVRRQDADEKKVKDLVKQTPSGARTQAAIDADIDAMMKKISDSNRRAKLDKEVLTDPRVVDYLTASDLKKMEKSGDVDLGPVEKADIMRRLIGPSRGKRTAQQDAQISIYLGTPDAKRFWEIP